MCVFLFFFFEYSLFLVVLVVFWALASGTCVAYRVFISSIYLLFFSAWGVFFLGYFYFLLYDQLACCGNHFALTGLGLGAGFDNRLGVIYL